MTPLSELLTPRKLLIPFLVSGKRNCFIFRTRLGSAITKLLQMYQLRNTNFALANSLLFIDTFDP